MATSAAVQDEAPATRFAKDQLKAIIERIERLEEEKANIGADIRDVFMSSGWSLKHAHSDLAGRERVLSFAPGKIGTS